MNPIISLVEANLETALLIFAGAFMIFSLLNPTASTTFSREGKHFWIDRSLPINYSSHIIGRIISPMVLHLATILAITIGFNYFIKLDLIYLLIPFVVGFLGGIPLSLIGLIVDLKQPLLDWTNPQRAVKQNLNVLIAIVANLIFIVALAGLNYLFLKIDLNFKLIILVDIGLISLSSIVLYKYSIKYIGEKLSSIN